MTSNEILPEVPRVLKYLKAQDQLIALGSASKNARTILSKVDLLSHFDAIVDGNNVQMGKPDPEVFLKAANLLNLPANACIVFEDAQAGIEAANAANMISIGIGDKDVLSHADYIFNDFTEIKTEFLKEIIDK